VRNGVSESEQDFSCSEQQYMSQSKRNIHHVPEKMTKNSLYITLTNMGIILSLLAQIIEITLAIEKLQSIIYTNTSLNDHDVILMSFRTQFSEDMQLA